MNSHSRLVADSYTHWLSAVIVFAVVSTGYAALSLGGGISFSFGQAILMPARLGLGLIDSALSLNMDLAWCHSGAPGVGAALGRSLAVGITAVVLFVPTRLYVLGHTGAPLAFVIAAWAYVVLSVALYVFLWVALEAAWRD